MEAERDPAQLTVAEQILRDYPVQLIAATLGALADMIMVCMEQDPKKSAHYRAWGFEILWKGIAANSLARSTMDTHAPGAADGGHTPARNENA